MRLPESLDNRHLKVVMTSSLRTDLLYPQEIPQSHEAAVTIMSTKNPDDTIGNATRVLPACSTPRGHPSVGRFSNIQPQRSPYPVNIPVPHILINVQRDATICSLYFILLQYRSTCFGCRPHPSSGAHKL